MFYVNLPSLCSIGYESKEIIEGIIIQASRGGFWCIGCGRSDSISRSYILRGFEKPGCFGDFSQRVDRLRDGLRQNTFYRRVKKQGRASGPIGAMSSVVPQQGLDAVRALVMLRNQLIPFARSRTIRLLENTPENCLRLPFLLEIFPDARAIYRLRDGRPNIHSLMEGSRQTHSSGLRSARAYCYSR